MKQIWSPWRLEYIEHCFQKNTKTKCFLCVAGSGPIVKNLILLKGKHSFVMMNRYPYNSGHLMVLPYRHIGLVEKLTEAETSEMFLFIQKSVRVLKKVLNPDGFNIGANIGGVAGAGVPGHVHFHVIPRWLGDTNFMSIVGDTKIINDSLNRIYNKLKKQLELMEE
jgi:ATP adenylyltransferase